MRPTKLAAACAVAGALASASSTAAVAAPTPSPPEAGGCHISTYAEPHLVTSGDPAQVFGVLHCAGGSTAVAGQTVTIYEHTAGIPGYRVLGTTTTGPGGAYTINATGISFDTTFYARALGAHSGLRSVRVAPLVTVSALDVTEGAQLKTGPHNKVAFSGSVSPEDNNAEVWLEREDATSNEEWHVIQRGFVRGSSYALVHRFVFPGDANLRVIVRPHGRFDVRGTSNTLSFEISQAQNRLLSIYTSADPVPYGQPVTLNGALASGAVGQHLAVLAHPAGVPAAFTKVGEVITEAGGAYKYVIPAATTSTFYEINGAGAHSAILFQGVKYVLTAKASAATVPAGQAVTFSGTVEPSHPGKVVYLERENASGGGFHAVDVASLNNGAYTITHYMFGSGQQAYRVRVPGDPSNQAASSTTFPVEVTPAPAGSLHPVAQGTLPR